MRIYWMILIAALILPLNANAQRGGSTDKSPEFRTHGNYYHPLVDLDEIPAQHVDAFSRVRVSSPGYRFDSQFTYQIDSDLWDQKVTGDGAIAHDATDRMATLTASTTAGANTAILQSHYHSPYTPGRGQLAMITFCMPTTPPANGEVGVGYYDGTNGIYLKKTATAITLNLDNSTSLANASFTQANWNIDTMDGDGDDENPSGLTLDLTKTNILTLQVQALFVGEVIAGFNIDGKIVPVHKFEHANISASPYIAIASLPVRYWASTSTDAGDATIDAICSTVISDGGDDLQDIPGREFAASGTLDDTAAGAAIVIRPKAQLNSINQVAVTLPTSAEITVEDAPCWIEIRRNATVTDGTFEDVNALSTVEMSYSGNAGTDPVVTAGTGQLIYKAYLPASAPRSSVNFAGLAGKAVLSYSHLLATADNLAIIWNGGTASTDVHAAIKWKEIR